MDSSMKKTSVLAVLAGIAILAIAAATPFLDVTITSSGVLRNTGTNIFRANSNLLSKSISRTWAQATNGTLTLLQTGDGSVLTSTGAASGSQLVTLTQLNTVSNRVSPITANGSGAFTDLVSSASVALTGAGGRITPKITGTRLLSWSAAQFNPTTNAATDALWSIRGDGVPLLRFIRTGSVSAFAAFVGVIPDGSTLTNGVTVTLGLGTENANPSNIVMQVDYQILGPGAGTLDSQNYTGTTSITSGIPGTTAVFTNVVLSCPAWNFTPGQTLFVRVGRIPGNAGDTNSGVVLLSSVSMNVISQ